MKKFKLGGLCALMLMLTLVSCEKDELTNNVPDAPVVPEIAKALVVNALLNQDLSNLTLKVGTTEIATGLDYKDLTDYLEVETGELLIDLLADDNTIVASTSYTFVEDQYYNIILVMDEDGLNPTIEILGQNYDDFELSDTYANDLGYNDGNGSVFAANAVSYNAAYKDQNFLIDVDYSVTGFAFLNEYLALEYGSVTDVFYGNDQLVSDLDLSVSALELTDLIDESGFVVVSETLLEDIGFANAGRYTVLLLGDELNFDSIVINHMDAGIVPE